MLLTLTKEDLNRSKEFCREDAIQSLRWLLKGLEEDTPEKPADVDAMFAEVEQLIYHLTELRESLLVLSPDDPCAAGDRGIEETVLLTLRHCVV